LVERSDLQQQAHLEFLYARELRLPADDPPKLFRPPAPLPPP